MSPSGKGDHSYNDMVLAGVTAAGRAGGVKVADVQPPGVSDYESALRRAVARKPDLVIAVGYLYADAIKLLAPAFPQSRFLLLDGDAGNMMNVRSVGFRPEEGSYIVGAIAGAHTRTGRVAYVAGIDIPIMRRFECGFRLGVERAHRSGATVDVQTRFIGAPDGFNQPSRGFEIARLLYDQNVDVIYHAAARSGDGIIRASTERKRAVIGVDTDQGALGLYVITSMRKRLDNVAAQAIRDIRANSFVGGSVELGVKEGGVDYVRSTRLNAGELALADSLISALNAGQKLPCQAK